MFRMVAVEKREIQEWKCRSVHSWSTMLALRGVPPRDAPTWAALGTALGAHRVLLLCACGQSSGVGSQEEEVQHLGEGEHEGEEVPGPPWASLSPSGQRGEAAASVAGSAPVGATQVGPGQAQR